MPRGAPGLGGRPAARQRRALTARGRGGSAVPAGASVELCRQRGSQSTGDSVPGHGGFLPWCQTHRCGSAGNAPTLARALPAAAGAPSPAPAARHGQLRGRATFTSLRVLKPGSARRLSTVPTAGPRCLSTVRARRERAGSRCHLRGTARRAQPPPPPSPVRSRRPSRRSPGGLPLPGAVELWVGSSKVDKANGFRLACRNPTGRKRILCFHFSFLCSVNNLFL